RTILISGILSEVMKAMELILEKLLSQSSWLHHQFCRSFIEDSNAGIKISRQDNNAGLNDRLVTLTGSFEEQMRAIFFILSKLIEDAHYPQTLNSPFPYSGMLFIDKCVLLCQQSWCSCWLYGSFCFHMAPVSYRPNGSGGKYPSNKVRIGIAEEHIGAVVGRGEHITQV
ncbi:hypothetical protein BHE74_00009884, partial [Ensete ventricosum]